MILRDPEESMVYAPDKNDSSPPRREKPGKKKNALNEVDVPSEEDNSSPLVVQRIRRATSDVLHTTKTGKTRRQLISQEIAEGNFERVGQLKVINTELAQKLVDSGLFSLQLSQLREISPECAKILAQYKGLLSLDSLKELTPDVAGELAQGTFGQLGLDGITQLNEETARVLSRGSFNALSLAGLEEMPDRLADILGNFPGLLYLDGIKRIETGTLRLLLKTDTLCAGKLKEVNPKMSEILKDFHDNDRVSFEYLEKIAPKYTARMRAYRELTEYENRDRRISIKRLSELFPKEDHAELHELLLKIYANGENKKVTVTELQVKSTDVYDGMDTFAKLSANPAVVSLQGLNTADDEKVIQILHAHKDRMFVPAGFERLFTLDTTMKIIKQKLPDHDRNFGIWKQVMLGNTRLVGLLTYVDEEMAGDLIKAFRKEPILPLTSGKTLKDASAAKKLATFEGSEIYLEKLGSIRFEAAKELAKFPGRVVLANSVDLKNNIRIWEEIMSGNFENIDQLTGIIPDIAAKLSASGLQELALGNVLEIGGKCAEILGDFPGEQINFNALGKITPELAYLLSCFKTSCLHLDGITMLDTRTAEYLFKFPGQEISLQGLLIVDSSLQEKIRQASCNVLVTEKAKLKSFEIHRKNLQEKKRENR